MTSLDKFVGREFRSRYVNPVWIKGMQKEGYAGAGAMREFVEYLWGWDATATDVVDDAMWQETFATYVEDKNKLGMKQFFEEKSPFAYQDITARMIETIRKDYWHSPGATMRVKWRSRHRHAAPWRLFPARRPLRRRPPRVTALRPRRACHPLRRSAARPRPALRHNPMRSRAG